MKQRAHERAPARPAQFGQNEVKYTATQHKAALLLAQDIPHYQLVGARHEDPICILVRLSGKDKPFEAFWRRNWETKADMWFRVRLSAALMFAKFGERPTVRFIYEDTPL